jgi:hypothetical protein
VTFDVTADVKGGKSSWLIKRTDEAGMGGVDFYSREGAAAAGHADLAPMLVIAGCTVNPEICNGLDDDCNGLVDDIPPQITTCGVGACAATGSTSCVNGQTVVVPCTPGTPSPEVCDGVDNDCNGLIDDGDVCGPGCVFIPPDCNGVIPGGIPKGCKCALNCANCIDSVCNVADGGICE